MGSAGVPAPQVFLVQDWLAIAMEYAGGGDLYGCVRHTGGLPEDDAKWFFQQILIAIDYCHRMVRGAAPTGSRLCREEEVRHQFIQRCSFLH